MSELIVKSQLLTEKLDALGESIRKIAFIKDGTKEKLEELKLSLRKTYDPNGMSKRLISASFNTFPCLQKLTDAVAFVDREISCVQNVHDNMKHDLERLQVIIKKKICNVNRCTEETSKLNSEILAYTLINLRELRELNARKKRLESVYNPKNVDLVLKYTEISNEIRESRENLQSVLTSLQEQKKEIIREYNDSHFIIKEYKSVGEKYYKKVTSLIELSEDRCEIIKQLDGLCKYRPPNWPNRLPNSHQIASYFQQYCDIIESSCNTYISSQVYCIKKN